MPLMIYHIWGTASWLIVDIVRESMARKDLLCVQDHQHVKVFTGQWEAVLYYY